MTWEENYLMHHGVKGQKWGVRRYQNEDGSLTAEGKARRQELREYMGKGAANFTEGGVDREIRLMRKTNKAVTKGKERKAERLTKKLEAQMKANDDAKAYAEKNSDKLNRSERWFGEPKVRVDKNGNQKVHSGEVAKKALRLYHKSKARGASSARAFCETFLPGGVLLRAIGNKKKYGKALVYDAVHEDDFVTTASPEDNVVPFGENDGSFHDHIVNSAEGSVSYGVKSQTWGVARGTGELVHYGIKGQKWGVRRFQNEDGSLTPAGKERYYTGSGNGNKSSTNAGRGSESGTASQSSGRSVKEAVQSKAVTAGGGAKGGFFSRVKKNWEEMVYPPEMRNKSKEEKKAWEKGEKEKFDEDIQASKKWKNFDNLSADEKRELGDKTLKRITTAETRDEIFDDYELPLIKKIDEVSGNWNTGDSVSQGHKKAMDELNQVGDRYWNREQEIKKQINYKEIPYTEQERKSTSLQMLNSSRRKKEFDRLNEAIRNDSVMKELNQEHKVACNKLAEAVLKDLGFSVTPENIAAIYPYVFND